MDSSTNSFIADVLENPEKDEEKAIQAIQALSQMVRRSVYKKHGIPDKFG